MLPSYTGKTPGHSGCHRRKKPPNSGKTSATCLVRPSRVFPVQARAAVLAHGSTVSLVSHQLRLKCRSPRSCSPRVRRRAVRCDDARSHAPPRFRHCDGGPSARRVGCADGGRCKHERKRGRAAGGQECDVLRWDGIADVRGEEAGVLLASWGGLRVRRMRRPSASDRRAAASA
jgi:hypothetical protein